MTNKNDVSHQANELRRQAEKKALEKPALSLEDIHAMSAEEIQQILHELRVHQIELEMQKEELRRVQAQIEAGRARYFDLYDQAPVGYCTLSEHGLILDANFTAATLLGLPRSELVTQPLSRFIHNDDQHIYSLHHKQLLGKATLQKCDLRLVKAHGGCFWAHLKETVTRADDGALLRRVVLSDISGRIQAEKQRETLAQKYAAVVSTTRDAVLAVNLDGRITVFNPGAEKLFGCTAEEALGSPVMRFCPEDLLGEQAEIIRHVLDTGAVAGYESERLTLDGRRIPVEITLSRHTDDQGGPFGISAILRDITERKRAEKALIESEALFRGMFEDHSAVMLLVDPNTGLIVLANQAAAQYYGYPLENLNQMNIQQLNVLSPTEIAEKMAGAFNKQINIFEFQHMLADGQIRDVQVHSSPITLQNQRLLLSIIHDITARKEADAKLQAFSRDFEAFLDQTTDFVYSKNLDSRIRFCSQTLANITGHRNWRDMVGKHDREIFPPDIAKIYEDEEAQVFSEGKPLLGKVDPYYDEKGETGYVQTNKWPLFDADGRLVGIFGISRDITERKQAEETLRESEEKFRALFEKGPIGVAFHKMVYDDSGKAIDYLFLDANSSYLELTGVDPRGQCVTEAFPGIENDPFDWIGTFGRVAKTGKQIRFEQYLQQTKRWYDCVGYQFKLDYFVAAFVDITDRKQAEAELQRSEEKFRQIITTVREGILSLDADWCIAFANAHLAKMLGYDLDELLGQSFEVFLHDEDRDDFARRKHERQQGQNSQFERRFKTKDGREIWTIVSASAFKDDKGDFAGSFGTITDITERKRAEDVLQASERRAIAQRMALSQLALHPAFVEGDTSRAFQVVAKSIAETLDVARTSVWILEEDGSRLRCHTLYQSDSKAFSSGAELNASTLPRYFAAIMAENRIYAEDAQNDPRTSEMAEDYLKPLGITSLLDSGIVIEGCLRGVVCSEHVGHMRKWHPDEEGFISTVSAMIAQLYVNAAIKRVEEEKSQLENKIHQSQKMEAIGQLAGGVAHDFNNMLGVITGYSEMILEQIDPTQQFHAELEEIQKAARRSADLTRQLLTFARKQTVTPRVLDLNQTIEGMLNMLRRLIGENIDLIWMPGSGLWPINMDPSQIDQILANLCVNGRDGIAGVGKLTVETKNASFDKEYCATHAGSLLGDYVRITVSDTGSGMDKETLAHIFEPFFTTKDVGEGTGLGLATVYGAVKQNNGFINVYSELGQGATFTIYIPRHVETTTETQVTASPKPVVRGNEIVMLVEDEPTLLQMSKTMLERLGYTVLAAGTPSEAIRLASEYAGQIHLLATDVIMPEMNGRELSVRLLESRLEIKCLYMSGYAANIIANQGVLKKGVPFLQKPFSINELAIKVREAMER